jgi:hypothetical protein
MSETYVVNSCQARRIAVQELAMSVVSVGIRAALFSSKALAPETPPTSERSLVMDFTNIAGVNCSPVGVTALTIRPQGMISQNRKVHDAQ